MKSGVNLHGVYGGRLDGARVITGTQLSWGGPAGGRMLNYFNTEFTDTRGVTLFGASSSPSNGAGHGVFVDSDNVLPSHNNYFDQINIHECQVGAQFGNSGQRAFQSDSITFTRFKITEATVAGMRWNSQNTFQGSVLGPGFFQQARVGNSVPMMDMSGFIPFNFEARGVNFGSGAGYRGSAVRFSQPANSGGSPVKFTFCEWEVPLSGKTIETVNSENEGGVIILECCNFGEAPLVFNGRQFIVSIGNFFGSVAPGQVQVNHPASAITSIGDVFRDPATQFWQVANGVKLVRTGQYGLANSLDATGSIGIRVGGFTGGLTHANSADRTYTLPNVATRLGGGILRDLATRQSARGPATTRLNAVSLPAGALHPTEGAVRIRAQGRSTGTAGARKVNMYFGNAVVAQSAIGAAAEQWSLEALVCSTSATTQKVMAGAFGEGGVRQLATPSIAVDTRRPVQIAIEGATRGAGDLVICEMLTVELVS